MISLLLAALMTTSIFSGSFTMTKVQATESGQAAPMEEAEWVGEARAALQEIVGDRDVMAVVYMSDSYPVKAEASYESDTLIEVPSGQTVFIQDVALDENYEPWEYVSFFCGEQEYHGYIQRNYLACSDERFLEWESEYHMNPAAYGLYGLDGSGKMRSSYADIEQFPASYQSALRALKDAHPNWIFVPMKTGLDWNTVIANEITDGKSLVEYIHSEAAKEGAYDNGSWYYASEEILKYYMDPRNSLTEEAVFQFEQLTYNETYHTESALEQFLQNTFMKGDKNAPGTSMTYSHIIWSIGKEEKRQVSPFHLAARIFQEQGSGNSALISGTYPGYEGYYNYFNISASGKTEKEVIENGLKYAKNANPQWNNAYYSILGGADIISANYIRRGQDTLYLQKYNVNPQGYYALYTHQYMQNIAAPTSEAKNIYKLYKNANALESPFVFKIPVYENMPGTACAKPTQSTNVVLQIPNGYDSTVYLDGVAYTGKSRNGNLIVDAGNTSAGTAVVYRYNEAGVPVGMYVWTLDYKDGGYIETAQPELTDLLSYHGFSIRIKGKSGIRFKTGISISLRDRLISEGVNGYKLKEYGTLVMNNATRESYPMIKGGEKVLSGMAYGVGSDGTLINKIFEISEDRYRYTSVLVDLPAEQYKQEYAFRGYMVLEKDGVEKTIYGPIVAKSIYSLAEQVLNANIYEAGSEADIFLHKLITDADAVSN